MKIIIGALVFSLFFLFFGISSMSETIRYSYDKAGRLTTTVSSDGALSVVEYDKGGLKIHSEKRIDAELSGIEISGPAEILENSFGFYFIDVRYGNGSVLHLTGNGVWSSNSPFATFDEKEPGLLKTGNVDSDENVTITASYQVQNATRTNIMNLVVRNTAPEGGTNCNSFPIRVIKDNIIFSCHTSLEEGYRSAHNGSIIQVRGSTSGIDVHSSMDKKVTIEGYGDANFTNGASVTMKDIEISTGTLIFR